MSMPMPMTPTMKIRNQNSDDTGFDPNVAWESRLRPYLTRPCPLLFCHELPFSVFMSYTLGKPESTRRLPLLIECSHSEQHHEGSNINRRAVRIEGGNNTVEYDEMRELLLLYRMRFGPADTEKQSKFCEDFHRLFRNELAAIGVYQEDFNAECFGRITAAFGTCASGVQAITANVEDFVHSHDNLYSLVSPVVVVSVLSS